MHLSRATDMLQESIPSLPFLPLRGGLPRLALFLIQVLLSVVLDDVIEADGVSCRHVTRGTRLEDPGREVSLILVDAMLRERKIVPMVHSRDSPWKGMWEVRTRETLARHACSARS